MQRTLSALLLALGTGTAHAGSLPTSHKVESGLEFGAKGLFQYDLHRLDGTPASTDVYGWRRRELGGYVRKGGVELTFGYDFANDAWIDNYLKLREVRIGQFKTPVGLDDGATSSAATTFIGRALPEAAIHQGRRIGIDWTHAFTPAATLNLGYFAGGDLNGLNEGHTVAARAALTPHRSDDGLLHVGLAASREWRDDATARLRARPEFVLIGMRPIDSGTLRQAGAIDRLGLETAWQRGPWSLQGEWLGARVHRDTPAADYRVDGGYLQGSWMLTGERKPNKGGGFGNPQPASAAGAFELALRYATLDLDDGVVLGGHQRDWTLGANWYLGRHLKLQANYTHSEARAASVASSPRIVGLRAQLAF